jgi:hypothetical protein
VLIGFPPKEVLGDLSASLSSLGVASGETIILEENLNASIPPPPPQPAASMKPSSTFPVPVAHFPQSVEGLAIKREIESDNSWSVFHLLA